MNDELQTEDCVFGEFNQLNRYLNDLDDRGLVLSVAAFAEDSLGSLIKAYFRPVKTTSELIDGFNAPLGTFSSRIKISYSVGLLGEQQFNDLERLRKIRNLFAHTWKPITFEDKRISEHIRKLNYSNISEKFPESLREKFVSSMSGMLIELRSAAGQLEKKGKKLEVVATRLIAGFSGDYRNQMDSARKILEDIIRGLSSKDKEEGIFYFLALHRLSERVMYINGENASDKDAVIDLHLKIKIILNKLSSIASSASEK
ncbi:TPA: transcriptional regulator [Pseudomonas aeruginosa]|nr:transcriptional regulator [Pseudomonas aeruginosa]HBN9510204.1 transcriptional regulator [Pseudomonas aeruginosa]HBN9780490.1 transcriptional regulator [Pseudomonas aeruginosa]HBN9849692.1 transcriptional regulator [Pseudomonas aeruginosa]HBN9863339.1 transcriptional regulator [Pseudomonas aeruginosa]